MNTLHEHIVFGLCFEYDFFREKKQTKLKTNFNNKSQNHINV